MNEFNTELTPVQKARQYLGQLKNLQRSIDNKLEHIKRLRAQTTNITAQLKPDPVQSSSVDTGFANTLNAIFDLEVRIHVEIKKQVDLKEEIIQRLVNMGMEHLQLTLLLEMHYLNGLRLEEIACEMNYAYAYTKRLKAQAERIFFEYM